MEMTAIEGTYGRTLGIGQNADDDFDKVSLIDHEEIYQNLVECLEIEEEQPELEDSSVKIVSNTCRIYTYYSEETAVVVQGHFTRSLQEGLRNLIEMNSKIGESEIPSKTRTTGRSKRMTKRKTVTSSTPFHVPISVPVPTHTYGRATQTRPHCSSTFLVPARVEMYTNTGAHYTPVAPPYGFQYKTRTNEYNLNTECSRDNVAGRQPAYTAFCNGNTLIEVYSPTVGRGFNPRYNSLLIEPTVHAYLPPIAGQSGTQSPTQADIQAFLHLAIEFNIPKQQ